MATSRPRVRPRHIAVRQVVILRHERKSGLWPALNGRSPMIRWPSCGPSSPLAEPRIDRAAGYPIVISDNLSAAILRAVGRPTSDVQRPASGMSVYVYPHIIGPSPCPRLHRYLQTDPRPHHAGSASLLGKVLEPCMHQGGVLMAWHSTPCISTTDFAEIVFASPP